MADREPPHFVIGGGPNQLKQAHGAERPTTARDVMSQKLSHLQLTTKLVEATTTDSIIDGFQLLIDNKILSIPLYSVSKQHYVGFLDIIDVVHHFLNVLNEKDVKEGYDSFKKRFAGVTCGEVSDLSGRNPYKATDTSGTLQAAVNLICHWKAHRVPLVDISGSLQHVFSQSYIAKALSKYIQLFPFVNKTITELNLGFKDNIITVLDNSIVKDALELMRKSDISGVGVVDAQNHLVGVLSVSDLREIGYDKDIFVKLYLSVSDFLKLIGQTRLVTVDAKTTVGRVAQIFITTGVHRIFILKEGKPVGIIALFDFIKLFDNFI
jgi:CBS domain-containing protein